MTAPVGFADAGALLRQRREALGLSMEQAATQLNLKAVVIRQLESGQWDPQVAPTFIRGYLRHYVRLLKLDETELLAQFDQQLAALPQASATMHSFSNKASRDAAESRFMLATYFLLVLLIGLFLVWFWQTHMLNEQPVAMLPESEGSVVSTTPSSGQSAVVITAPEVTTASPAGATSVLPEAVEPPSTTGSAINPEQSVVSTAGTAADAPALVATASNQPAPQPALHARPEQTTQATDPAAVTASDLATPGAGNSPIASTPESSPTTAAAQPEVAAAGTLTLQLQFSAQCWVAVTDGSGKRLAYSMQNGGQSLTLTGTGPFQVTFGDPTAVTASLSGKTLDLSGYKQGQVVRLTLTGSE